MNVLKVQQEVLKALCKGERVLYYKTRDDAGVFISCTGANGWVIPDEQLKINLTEAQLFADLCLENLVVESNKLIGTDDYRRGGTARRYKKKPHVGDSSVYVDTKLLKCFDSPILYQGLDKNGVIAVVEEPIDGEPKVVGCVLPVRVGDDGSE